MDDNEIPGSTDRPTFFAPNGDPVSLDLAEKLLGDAAARTVGKDRVASPNGYQVEVSTVFLIVDHNFGDDGPPVLWETAIFGHPDEPMWRYTSQAEALRRHHEICGLIRDYGLNMDLWPEPEE